MNRLISETGLVVGVATHRVSLGQKWPVEAHSSSGLVLISLLNGLSTFVDYLMQSILCRRTILVLFKP